MGDSKIEEEPSVLQFTQFQSFVNPSFWHKLSEIKLEEDRLSDAPKSIVGYYTNRKARSCLLEVNINSLSKNALASAAHAHKAEGTLYNKNTVEDFKECDKMLLLQEEGRKLIQDFNDGSIEEHPSKLARFFLLSFADLKSHNYYYWFGFPCPLTPPITYQRGFQKLSSTSESEPIKKILKDKHWRHQNFFVLQLSESTMKFYTLKELFSSNEFISNIEDYYFFFADCSEFGYPSWILRLYIIFVFHKCPMLAGKFVKFIGLRYDDDMDIGNSLVWEVTISQKLKLNEETVKMVGWEPNRNCKLAPRMVSLRSDMDPAKLAESSVNLNLKLMKWRLLPELNLNYIVNIKCLLFGAGTLGCGVARNLLAWGFKHITFVDSGRVGYSNPVRQSLFVHADAINGNIMKAEIAAKRIKEINPCVVSAGYVIQIPMPGHTVGDILKEETEKNFDTLIELVKQTDVIFMLTDSRESRWLPTLLGTAYQKIVINAALGFDSYLVMRHGSNKKTTYPIDAADIGDLKCLHGSQLGCYFCNDVTAPGNVSIQKPTKSDALVIRTRVFLEACTEAVFKLDMVHAGNMYL